ncbi:MAG: PIN domain-containing protein [Ignavibacteriae bacterium]|nr:PIN domain-containing protein [Ignavibacteriota bacterium]NOG98862.1 PIN domain-containing protein [Ignavibacteriota bacterium]
MKDRLFLDTNIVLDLLGERKPYYNSIAKIATLADKRKLRLMVSALSYSTIFYLLAKVEKKESVKEKLRKFKIISETSDLTDKIIEKALSSNFKYFEDALQYHCALSANCNILITRNVKDFIQSELPVMTAKEYLNKLKIN